MVICVLFQAEDGIRDLVRSRGLGDVYKRQYEHHAGFGHRADARDRHSQGRWRAAQGHSDAVFDLSLIHI